MTAALLSIGAELVRGETIDANGPWLAAELTSMGHAVVALETAGDEVDAIAGAISRLAARAEVVVATGGLGPTPDDVTAEAAARAAGAPLLEDESALLAIRRRVEARARVMTPGHEKQARLPGGAELLTNAVGAAPGFSLAVGGATVFFLPGVPREAKRMFADQVAPRLAQQPPDDRFVVRLRTYGIGETALAGALEDLSAAFPDVTLSYRSHFPEVDVRVSARAATPEVARELAGRAADDVRARLGDVVYGVGDESFPEIVGRAVRARDWRLALAESCTGGLVAQLVTSVPASVDYFVGGAVTYANSSKGRLLEVREDTLRGCGAISGEVAAEMAEAARRLCACEVALAITGVAGPSGGTSEKPVGLCYWAVAHPGGTIVRDKVFKGDREEVQRAGAYAGLDLLRRVAAGLPEGTPR
jgi:nicotinamide-nucleotide amidase